MTDDRMPDDAMYRRVHSLYERNRFVDAYELTRDLFDQPEVTKELEAHELVLAGRLASRLGNRKVARWLSRLAVAKDPAHPAVKVHCQDARRRRFDILRDILTYTEQAQLGSQDKHLNTIWLAQAAIIFAHVRDFATAQERLDGAKREGADPSWTFSAIAHVRLQEDRWQEALEAATEAWRITPGHPSTAHALAEALTFLGRQDEIPEILDPVVDEEQSFELSCLAIWNACQLAERNPVTDRARQLLDKAKTRIGRLEGLAPLADRESKRSIARLNCCLLLIEKSRKDKCPGGQDVREGRKSRKDKCPGQKEHENREELVKQARLAGSHYFRAIANNIEANPNGERVIVTHDPIFQKHDTCLPASFCTVLSSFGEQIDLEQLTEELTYGGTMVWRLRDWCEEQGLLFQPFIADREGVTALITAGIPFLLTFTGINSAHSVAGVGIDEAQGTLIIHDPAIEGMTEILLDHLGDQEAPFGPTGAVVLPVAEKDRISNLQLTDRFTESTLLDFAKAVRTGGREEREEVLERLRAEAPDHPTTLRVMAWSLEAMGDVPGALEIQRGLIEKYPSALGVQVGLLRLTERLENTPLMREVLERIIERGALPGFSDRSDWIGPDAQHLTHYAELLCATKEGRTKAERLLRRAIAMRPAHALAYHVLGDIFWEQGRSRDSELMHRISSLIDFHNEHFARSYAEMLRRNGDEDRAIGWLLSRVKLLGTLPDGSATWQTLIDALLAVGRPKEALETVDEALAARPADGSLIASLIPYFTASGQIERARELLPIAEEKAPKAHYLSAAAALADFTGDREHVLDLAKEWRDEDPGNLWVSQLVLRLLAEYRGTSEALRLAREWAKEHPKDERYEDLLLEFLGREGLREEQITLLSQRVSENSEDSPAWRRIADLVLTKLADAPSDQKKEIRQQAEEVLTQCERTCPDHPDTLLSYGRFAELIGEEERAVDVYARALDHAPENIVALLGLFDATHRWQRERKTRLIPIVESAIERTVGHLHCARTAALLLADAFGLEEATRCVDRWRGHHPDDPEVLEAYADLLVEYGGGREGAEKARVTLEPAVERFPGHVDLRLSLAWVYGILGKADQEEKQLKEIIARAPRHSLARQRLAHAYERSGSPHRASELLDEALKLDPLEASNWVMLAEHYWSQKRYEEALEVLERAVQQLPAQLSLWEERLDKLEALGRVDHAISNAEELAEQHEDKSRSLLLLALALQMKGEATDRARVESVLRESIASNADNFRSLDMLVVFLTEQSKFDDALRLLDEQSPKLSDTLPARVRRLWVQRVSGDVENATRELSALVCAEPRYGSGWYMLMEWINADQDWETARRMLQTAPPEIAEDVGLQIERLRTLRKTGIDAAEVDPEWNALVMRFPHIPTLVMARFDDLWSQEEYSAASLLLGDFAEYQPNNTSMLARAVRVALKQEKEKEALELALRVWTAPPEDDPWPEIECLVLLKKAEVLPRAISSVIDGLEEGLLIRSNVLRQVISHLHDERNVKQMRRMVEVLEKASFHTHEILGVTLSLLIDLDDVPFVEQWYADHEQICAEETHLWQIAGLLHARASRHREVVKWMGDWRERDGLDMFSLTTYSQSCVELANWQEVRQVSSHALEHLVHDHTAWLMAWNLAESCLRLGRDDEFRICYKSYGHLIRAREDALFVAELFGAFEDLFAARDRFAIDRALARFRSAYPRAKETCGWAKEAWKRRYLRRAKGLSRYVFLLRSLFS